MLYKNLGLCHGLHKNAPHRLSCLNTGSPGGEATWGGLGGIVLLEELCPWEWAFRTKILSLPVCSVFMLLSLAVILSLLLWTLPSGTINTILSSISQLSHGVLLKQQKQIKTVWTYYSYQSFASPHHLPFWVCL